MTEELLDSIDNLAEYVWQKLKSETPSYRSIPKEKDARVLMLRGMYYDAITYIQAMQAMGVPAEDSLQPMFDRARAAIDHLAHESVYKQDISDHVDAWENSVKAMLGVTSE